MQFGRSFPKIMGILNVTPDSFSDGGRFSDVAAAVRHAERMIEDGADMLDVGGESTRPGAAPVEPEVELARVLPVIKGIRIIDKDIPLSIDTSKFEVARAALDAGANMINDVSGLRREPRLARLAADYDVPLVIMHSRDDPRTMQTAPRYEDVIREVLHFLTRQLQFARSCGARQLIADIGIGFAKTQEHNLLLLRHHDRFAELGLPMLLGISRKSFIGKQLGIDKPEQRDYATLALHLYLLNAGVDIVRVHNVTALGQARDLLAALRE